MNTESPAPEPPDHPARSFLVEPHVGLGFFNEYRSEVAVAALHDHIRHDATVWSDGAPVRLLLATAEDAEEHPQRQHAGDQKQVVADHLQQTDGGRDRRPPRGPQQDGCDDPRGCGENGDDNYAAAAGMAALAAARHDFAGALDWAQRGLAINRANATLYGALADAQIQLGHYPEAFEATQRMVDLAPTTASLARVSYVWELRGDIEQATANMTRALGDAATPADKGFARYYLGELAFNAGDATGALAQYQAGLAVAPAYAPLLEGKAKAEAALGQTDAAIADYTRLVERVPQPSYLVQLGELFESLGRKADADAQYSLFGTEATLFQANGVTLDAEQALFYADHGDPAAALRAAEAGIATRGFLDMDDAYAWALHVNGRDAEALSWSKKALALGTRSALFHFHAGMIQLALGDTASGRAKLATALAINPNFSTRWAPSARQALDDGVISP